MKAPFLDVRAGLSTAVATLFVAAGPAAAAEADVAAVDEPVVTVGVPSEAVHIRVGRAVDPEGAPVYAARSVFSGAAGITTFSTHRIAPLMQMAMPSGSFGVPLTGRLTSGFGARFHPLLGRMRQHSGIDLAAPAGSPIVAPSAGVVSQAGWNGGYGLYVALDHGGGLQTRYGHMSHLAVSAGQQVRRGDIIGYVGTTGLSTGPHLHYEMRVNGQAVPPRSLAR
ncbi:M23 family metallopeptidase [Novosphingobium tardum]|uniref:M23 family metallopeptidase n=1 Tax=Novosphingobium tardum TaxID=1538021 RepID=A0ABV8RMK5_9SPHN